jgi:hypothetical protein
LKIVKTTFQIPLLGILVLGLLSIYCGKKKEVSQSPDQEQPAAQHEILETDYAGKIKAFLSRSDLTVDDSIKLVQAAYQMASLDNELYNLQSELILRYFDACDQKCQSHKCTDGEIIAAAIAYYFKGNTDTVAIFCSQVDKSDKVCHELSLIIGSAADNGNSFNAEQLLQEINSPLSIAFLSVLALDKGSQFKFNDKLASLNPSQPEVIYSRAYALALQGDVVAAWNLLPYYAPLSRNYPEPSLVEEIKGDGNTISKKIYFPLAYYIRAKIDQLLLSKLIGEMSNESYLSDIAAVRALSVAKGLPLVHLSQSTLDSLLTLVGSDNPKGELLISIKAALSSPDPVAGLMKLKFPVSRAAYLRCWLTNNKSDTKLSDNIFAESDSSRRRVIWESRIFLSNAMISAAGEVEAFRRMSNFGVSDLSVRNNSPEWLAIYARASLSEASQLSLASQLIYNLSQHYPNTIGFYETVQNYNHLCKYY